MKLWIALLIAICCMWLGAAFALVGEAYGSINSQLSPPMRADATCVDEIGGGRYAGWFTSSVPPSVQLLRSQVCSPIRRFWRVGFPSSVNTRDRWVHVRREQLAYALFVVAHEEQHVEQFEATEFTSLLPVNSEYTWIESDADCGAAQELRPWSQGIGVNRLWQRNRLRDLAIQLQPGYDSGIYTEGCWR